MRVSPRTLESVANVAHREAPLSATWRQAQKRKNSAAGHENSPVTKATTPTAEVNPRLASPTLRKRSKRIANNADQVQLAAKPPAADIPAVQTVKAPRKRRKTKAAFSNPDEVAGPPLPALTAMTLPVGVAHITAVDPGLARLAERYGCPSALVVSTGSTFHSLTRAIVGQQLAVSAAATIYGRFRAACRCEEPKEVAPEAVLAVPLADLRAAGLSGMKASYLLDLAAHYTDNRLSCESIRGMSEPQIIESLTAVKGIGRWTADMFAMFSMGRPDVLPVGDLGVRQGFKLHFRLQALPKPEEMERLAEHWQPYRSLGSWYMWRLCEERKPAKKKTVKGGASEVELPAAAATLVPL